MSMNSGSPALSKEKKVLEKCVKKSSEKKLSEVKRGAIGGVTGVNELGLTRSRGK